MSMIPWIQQFLDDEGRPLSGGKVYAYLTGTTTPEPVYGDDALSVQLTNPVVLPSSGRARIFLNPTRVYRIIVTDSRDVTLYTVDGVRAPQQQESATGEGGAFFFGGDPQLGRDDRAYPPGYDITDMAPGTRIVDVNGDVIPRGAFSAVLACSQAGTVKLGLFNATNTASTPAVELTFNFQSAGVRRQEQVVALPREVKSYGVKIKTTAGVARAWGVALDQA